MVSTRLLVSMTISAALLLAGIGAVVDGIMSQNADAQTIGANDTGNMSSDAAGNTSSGMTMKPAQNITSSINLVNIIPQAIGSKVNVSLSDAATTAEDSIGNNSHAAAAHIDEHNGYLVYNIMVIDPNMNFSKVIVDPGNGDILLTEQISKEEHLMMHKMGGQHMMGPGMMGPGMMGPSYDDGTNERRYDDGRIFRSID